MSLMNPINAYTETTNWYIVNKMDNGDLLLAINSKDYSTISTILKEKDAPETVVRVLELGCGNGETRLVELALQYVAGNIRLIEKKHLLYTACQKGYSNIVGLLLQKGVQPDLQKNNGWSALSKASQKG